MGYFTTQRGIIPRLYQHVFINGILDSSIRCDSVSLPSGLEAATASFYCPELVWTSNLEIYRDARISVLVSTNRQTWIPVFLGYIDNDSAQLSPTANTATFGAKSIVAWLKKVKVGDPEHVPVKTYRLIDPITNQPTHWTPKNMLQDIWFRMGSYFRAKVGLGITTALSDSADVDQPELTFRNSGISDATEELLALWGNVSCSQRFSDRTYLDFWRIGDPSNPVSTVRVAALGEPVTAGSNVGQIRKAVQSSDITTRVTAYGTGRRFAITITSFDPDPAKRLQPNWDSALEAAVLADPKLAGSGSTGARPGMDLVFRQFRIPAALRGCKFLNELPVTVTNRDGSPKAVANQAFAWQTVLVDDPANMSRKVGVQVSAPVVESGVKWELDKGLVTFNKPMVRASEMTVDAGQPIVTWQSCPVEITIGIEDPQHYSYAVADGSVSAGINYDFASDGLSENVIMDNLSFCQLTNAGYPIGGKTWNCRVYNDSTRLETLYTSATVTSNPQSVLQRIAAEQLANSCRRSVSLEVEIPWFAPGYAVGNRLVVLGESSVENDVFTITGISYDFSEGGQTTTISADNAKPKRKSSVRTQSLSAAPADSTDSTEQYGEPEEMEPESEVPEQEFDPEEMEDA